MGRRELRDIAVKCVFQYDFICARSAVKKAECVPENFDADNMIQRLVESIAEENGVEYESIVSEEEYESYFKAVVLGTVENLKKIDEAIEENSHGWDFDRISSIDLAVLRVAVYELMFREDVPAVVAINEAIEISKKYSGEKSGTYVNGVLGGIYSSVIEE